MKVIKEKRDKDSSCIQNIVLRCKVKGVGTLRPFLSKRAMVSTKMGLEGVGSRHVARTTRG